MEPDQIPVSKEGLTRLDILSILYDHSTYDNNNEIKVINEEWFSDIANKIYDMLPKSKE
jgi:hypothetical protein